MTFRKVFEHPDVYQIILPMIQNSLPTVNVYLIHSKNSWLMVDAGPKTPDALEILSKDLKELKVDFDALEVFITHQHFDHWGLLKDLLPKGTSVHLSLYDYDLSGESANSKLEDLYQKRMKQEGVPKEEREVYTYVHRYYRLADKKDFKLVNAHPGDELQVGDESFKIVSASGHTPDHLALYHKRSGMYFCGDQVLVGINPSIDLSFDGLDLMGNNLKRLKSLLDKELILMPGHGEIMHLPHERIQALYEHHFTRTQDFYKRIKEHPYASGYDLIRQNKWSIEDSWDKVFFVKRSLIIRQGFSYLNHLLEKNMIETLENGEQMRYKIS